jgi:hypothetical protein
VASTVGLVALFASGKSAGAGSDAESASARVVRSGSAATPAAAAGAAVSSTTTALSTQTTPLATDGASRSASGESSTPSSTAASPTLADATTVVDGAAYDNRWGKVQVEATFDATGVLVDVVALQTPNDRDKSIRINDRAVRN